MAKKEDYSDSLNDHITLKYPNDPEKQLIFVLGFRASEKMQADNKEIGKKRAGIYFWISGGAALLLFIIVHYVAKDSRAFYILSLLSVCFIGANAINLEIYKGTKYAYVCSFGIGFGLFFFATGDLTTKKVVSIYTGKLGEKPDALTSKDSANIQVKAADPKKDAKD